MTDAEYEALADWEASHEYSTQEEPAPAQRLPQVEQKWLWGQWRDGRAYIVDQDGFQVVQDIDEQIAREVVQNHNDHIAAKGSAPC